MWCKGIEFEVLRESKINDVTIATYTIKILENNQCYGQNHQLFQFLVVFKKTVFIKKSFDQFLSKKSLTNDELHEKRGLYRIARH